MNDTKISVQIAIEGIHTNQFALIGNPLLSNRYEVETRAGFQIDDQQGVVACITEYTFSNEGSIFLKLEVECLFRIHPDDWTGMVNSEGTIRIDKDVLQQMISLSIGTSRGIIHAKTESTPFKEVLLPLISPNSLFDGEDLIVPTNNPQSDE